MARLMEDVLKIASYICDRYKREYGQRIDEMKLHKLLYLLQREAIIQTGEPLLQDQFEAWKYGPNLYIVHKHYHADDLHEELSDEALAKYKPLFDKVFETYAAKSSWSLSTFTHGEYSWQKEREGYEPDEHCEVKIKTDDIKVDAQRLKTRKSLLHIPGIQTPAFK